MMETYSHDTATAFDHRTLKIHSKNNCDCLVAIKSGSVLIYFDNFCSLFCLFFFNKQNALRGQHIYSFLELCYIVRIQDIFMQILCVPFVALPDFSKTLATKCTFCTLSIKVSRRYCLFMPKKIQKAVSINKVFLF